MPIRQRLTGQLEPWYSSEDAKRRIGWLCQTVNENHAKVGLLGSREEPVLFLEDVETCEVVPVNEQITIEEARSNWPAVTIAAAVLGTTFRVEGKKRPRAILYANDCVQHPALKYRHSASSSLESIASRLEELTREIRRVNQINECTSHELRDLCDSLAASSEIIDQRFTSLWRRAEGYPAELQ